MSCHFFVHTTIFFLNLKTIVAYAGKNNKKSTFAVFVVAFIWTKPVLNTNRVQCSSPSEFQRFPYRLHPKSLFQKSVEIQSTMNPELVMCTNTTYYASVTVISSKNRTHLRLHKLWMWPAAVSSSWWPEWSWMLTHLCQSCPLRPDRELQHLLINKLHVCLKGELFHLGICTVNICLCLDKPGFPKLEFIRKLSW